MSEKPNPRPAFAPEGIVWKRFTQQRPTGLGDATSEGAYAEVVGGWVVKFSLVIPRRPSRCAEDAAVADHGARRREILDAAQKKHDCGSERHAREHVQHDRGLPSVPLRVEQHDVRDQVAVERDDLGRRLHPPTDRAQDTCRTRNDLVVSAHNKRLAAAAARRRQCMSVVIVRGAHRSSRGGTSVRDGASTRSSSARACSRRKVPSCS